MKPGFHTGEFQWRSITAEQVLKAREWMASGELSLKEVAEGLGLISRDLDKAMWRYFGEKIELEPGRPEPMF